MSKTPKEQQLQNERHEIKAKSGGGTLSMSKVIIRTGDAKGFFARANAAARKADRGERLEKTMMFSFEDPAQMFAVLSEKRVMALSETDRYLLLLYRVATYITLNVIDDAALLAFCFS